MQAEILWLMAAKTKWQDSEAKKQEAEAAQKAGDEKRAAQLSHQSRQLLEAARGILNSANTSNPGAPREPFIPEYQCKLHERRHSAVRTAQDTGSRSQEDPSDAPLHPVLCQDHIQCITVEQSLHCKDTVRMLKSPVVAVPGLQLFVKLES